MRRGRKQPHELAAEFDLSDLNPDAMLAGWFLGRIVRLSIFLLVPGLALTFGAFAAYSSGAERGDSSLYILAVLPGTLALLFLAAWFANVLGSRASTPKRAVQLFFRMVAGKRYKGARKLVIPNDLDNFPRFFPADSDIGGYPPADPVYFDAIQEFEDYWRALLRWPTAATCVLRIRQFEVEQVTSDLAICDFRVRAGVNTSLWLLLLATPLAGLLIPGSGPYFVGVLVWPALIVAAVADAVTRKWITRDLTKVLVRVDDEWHLFDGAWDEFDEEDLSWLPEKADG
jgi:hypothetical protein